MSEDGILRKAKTGRHVSCTYNVNNFLILYHISVRSMMLYAVGASGERNEGTTGSTSGMLADEERWAGENVKEVFDAGTWAALSSKLGYVTGMGRSCGVAHWSSEAGAFLQQCRDNLGQRSTLLKILSREDVGDVLKSEGARIKGVVAYYACFGVRMDNALSYVAAHPADGMLSKLFVALAPVDVCATNEPSVHDTNALKRMLRSRTARATRFSAGTREFRRKHSAHFPRNCAHVTQQLPLDAEFSH